MTLAQLQPSAEEANADARASLASREIPTMSLSRAANPLTAPLSPLPSHTPAARATARFAIEGNAVVVGGAGSLALAASRALLEHGLSSLCLFDLPTTLNSSNEQILELRAAFPDNAIYTIAVDITSASTVADAFGEAAALMGAIDILCCFAGVVDCVHSISTSTADFNKVVNVNLTGSFTCAQAAAQHMIKSKKGGCILLTGSISAHHVNYPQPQAAYNVSKIGVVHLTRNLAAEWTAYGIRVNCISPGYMDTVLNHGDKLQKIRNVWADHCPFGRMGDVEEITGGVVLLCSRRAGRYITGADLLIDGGAMCF